MGSPLKIANSAVVAVFLDSIRVSLFQITPNAIVSFREEILTEEK
jgi:hypothetical protein